MKILLAVLAFLLCAYAVLKAISLLRRDPKNIDEKNPYLNYDSAEGVLPDYMAKFAENMPNAPNRSRGVYEVFFKRVLDAIISFFGLLILSPVFLALIIAIKIDDPGPAFFTQTRVGRNKKFFRLHKFRSMKMSTPHDIPTHMLQNPEQYITRVGVVLRRLSLDELPQIWDIFRGKMSIIGPRPALWNQADLVSEREGFGINELSPGLTGLAQINGRDELLIPEKVKFDAEYLQNMGFGFDTKCFFGTMVSVVKRDGIVEGGTGKLQKHTEKTKK